MKRVLVASALGMSLLLTTARLASAASCATADPTGSMTLAAREAANSTCSCATATNHGQYVKCVAGVAKSRVTAGTLPKSCKGAVVKCAAHSTCGKTGFVTCCTTAGCKPKKSAAACTAKGGTVGTCKSCCDACPAPGSGPSCSPSGAFLDETVTGF